MAWRFWRPKRGWWQELAGFALAIALAIPSGLLAIPVSQYTGVWVLLAEVAGLAIALAATVGFFVVKHHSWLLAAPLSFGLWFSFALALMEGWYPQINLAVSAAKVVLVVGAIGVMGATFVIVGKELWRMNHETSDLARAIGEHIANEGLFHDDGERIIVSANRGRVVLQALTTVMILALLVAGDLWVRAILPNVLQIVIAICLGVLLWFGGLSALLMLIRTLMTSPTLVVSADGIVDNSSMIITGRGLLRWNETLGVEEYIYSNRGMTYRFLDINVTDSRAINRRQPLWKRTLASFASQRQSMSFRIRRSLLDRPPAELATEIGYYIHTHAPDGSWHKVVTEDEAEQLGEE